MHGPLGDPVSANYFYTNGAATLEEFEEEIRAFDAAGIVVDLRRAWCERESQSRSALERPGMQSMLRRIRAGDTIFTLKLASLGRNVRDVLETLERFKALGASAQCIELGGGDLLTSACSPAMLTLAAVSQLDYQTRSLRMKESATASTELGRRLGRKPTLSASARTDILASLRTGASVTEIARSFCVSRQTIMRIRDEKLTDTVESQRR